MPKKRSGFYYFMLEFKEKAERRGKIYAHGLGDIQNDADCRRQWNALSAAEKMKYTNAGRTNTVVKSKLCSWGTPVTTLEENVKKRTEYMENMKCDIEETVNLANLTKKLTDVSFFFIHVNYFYSKEAIDTSVQYIPAEMAICEFTIGHGCTRYYHQVINITVELGYTREVIEHAEQTHKLHPKYEGGEGDYHVILEKFQAFLEPELVKTGKMPPVYTSKKHYDVAKCFMDYLKVTSESEDWTGNKKISNLYILDILFGRLMAACNSELLTNSCNPTLLAEIELQKGCFAYTPNIECKFHQKIEGTSIYCSLAIIHQWVFLICDYCCFRLGVTMIKAVHYPIGVEEIDQVNSQLSNLRLSPKNKMRYVTSPTEVTQSHRDTRANRTPVEEVRRRRRDMSKPLTVVDHGQLQPADSKASLASSVDSPGSSFLKPLRLPKTVANIVEVSQNVPLFDEINFPPIGRSSSNKTVNAKKNAARGRGRGGIPLDK